MVLSFVPTGGGSRPSFVAHTTALIAAPMLTRWDRGAQPIRLAP